MFSSEMTLTDVTDEPDREVMNVGLTKKVACSNSSAEVVSARKGLVSSISTEADDAKVPVKLPSIIKAELVKSGRLKQRKSS